MTTEEKLEKAIEFIQTIEKMSLPIVNSGDIVNDAYGYCDDCGEECDINFTGPFVNYVEENEFEKLKDKAWHLLADLTD